MFYNQNDYPNLPYVWKNDGATVASSGCGLCACCMNPVDHPHGGGEGKAPIGHPGPVTPWGKPTLGYKTRKKNHRTDKQIVKRRNGK